MKSDVCDVSFVLDRSGSMESVRDDTIGGFNAFVKAQQALPGECIASLLQFDNVFETVYTGKPIKDVPPLTRETFVPRNATALLDAIGKTINATGARLSALPEADRPGKVIVVILTDGGENASREFTQDAVFKMIAHQRETYQWDFVFIGANQDAIAVGGSLGVSAGKSISYAANQKGTHDVFASVSAYVGTMRSGVDANFTAQDRQNQADAGVPSP